MFREMFWLKIRLAGRTPLQISTSEILLIFGVLRNVELISNTEIEQTTLETHEIGVLFSKSLNETAWTSVVLPRECHERMTRIDRYCVSWRIVTTSDLGGDPCLRSRYSSSSAGRTSICVHFTIKIHWVCISPSAPQLEVKNFDCYYL